MEYLKSGKFTPGASRKQCKRIENLSEHCVLIKDEIWYMEDPEKPNQRITKKKELIQDADLLGHFAAHETYLRLKEKYYWKKMIKEFKRIIRNCIQCRRYQLPQASPITAIFDRIAIDLVFGFRTTNKGLKGIPVITEYLSKFQDAIPIKTKTAEETEEHLLKYMCTFGAPKIILSDMGREFLKKITDLLLKRNGVERRITSA